METIVKQLRTACDNAGDVQFRESYSGRGMYGRACVGIVGTMDDCMAVIAEINATLTQELFDTAIDAGDGEENAAHDLNDAVQAMQRQLFRFSWDSMGWTTIVYWPAIDPEPVGLPTDEEIGAMPLRKLAALLKDDWADYVSEDDVITPENIRTVAKSVRDRVKEDLPG